MRLFLLFATLGAASAASPLRGPLTNTSMCRDTPGWRVTFEDEFEGDALNTSNWVAWDNKTHGTFSGTSMRSVGGSGGLGQQDARCDSVLVWCTCYSMWWVVGSGSWLCVVGCCVM